MGVAFRPDGKGLAAVSRESVLLSPEGGAPQRVVHEPDTPLATPVASSPDGAVLATGRAMPRDGAGRLRRASDGSHGPLLPVSDTSGQARRDRRASLAPAGFRSSPLKERRL
jgi:hypothetical protein